MRAEEGVVQSVLSSSKAGGNELAVGYGSVAFRVWWRASGNRHEFLRGLEASRCLQ